MTMTQGTLVDIDILSVTPILKNSVVIKPQYVYRKFSPSNHSHRKI